MTTRQRLARTALRWHRPLALAGAAGLLVWGLSGLLHPIMTTFGPQQAVFAGPQRALDLTDSMPLATILADSGIAQAAAVRIVAAEDAHLLQVTVAENQPRRYFSLQDGRELPDHDRRQAEFLARHYLQLDRHSVAVQDIRLQTDFDSEYAWVNRLLPVYRVQFGTADRLTAYVYTETGALAAVNSDFKRLLQNGFRWLHTWDWIPERALWLRLLVVTVLVGTLLLLAASGLFLLWSLRRRHRVGGARGWHRAAGYLLGLPLAMLSFSGLFHLYQTAWADTGPNLRFSAPLDLRALQPEIHPVLLEISRTSATQSLSLIADADGTLLYRLGLPPGGVTPETPAAIRSARFAGLQGDESALYLNAHSGLPWTPGDRELALRLGEVFSGAGRDALKDATLVTRFGIDYDFRNKRLPVWRLDYGAPVNAILFVDTNAGVLADRVAKSAMPERLSFSFLHKWNFLRPLGHSAQNLIISVVVMAAVLLMAGLGAAMYFKHRASSKQA